MSNDLIRIAYVSRAHLLDGEAGERQIAEILKRSRWWNESVGITGALMFNRGLFSQVLEGPRQEVDAIFDAIRADPRHEGVIKLDWSILTERSFPGWSMAYVGEVEADERRFGGLGDATGFDRSVMARERLFRILTLLMQERERAAA